MLQTILDAILYIPRKIYRHFELFRETKEELTKVKEELHKRDLLIKRIEYKCNYYMKTNSSIMYSGLSEIKELTHTFGDESKF